MRRFIASTLGAAEGRRRGRALSTALPRRALKLRSSTQQLPQNVHIYGGTDQERRALEARLQRVYQKSPMLQLESTGIVILNDSFPAPESASSAESSSSGPLLQALLEFPLITDSSLLTVFNVGQQKRRELVAARGEDVVEAWSKDTLRRHLASIGGFGARRPLLLEPALLDLSSDTDAEDDEELAWALSRKRALAAAAAVPRSLLPPRYMQPGRMVCLVFPHRLVKSTEWLHRLQRQLVDFARTNLVPIQTHFLALDKATSPDPSIRAAEAQRFAEMARRLPPSLILGEEAALPQLVEWTARLSSSKNAPHHEVSTYNLALTNSLFKSPSDVFAGPRVLCSLSVRSRVLVAYHIPHALATPKTKEASEHRGDRVVSVLARLFDERAHGDPALVPQIEAGELNDRMAELPSFSLCVMHSGSHAVDDEGVKEMLEAASEANVPVITPGMLRAFFRGGPRTVAAALRPWPSSFSIQSDDAADATTTTRTVTTQEPPVGAGAGRDVWDFGFRDRKASDCSDCGSWSCATCTGHQQGYAARLGKQHRGGIGQDWRDMF